jgi:hypothetical protein
MGKRKYPTNVIRQAQKVLNGLSQITPAPTITGVTVAGLTTEIAAVATVESQIASLETQLNDKRNLRDAQCAALWDKVKRSRNTVKGTYGDDSPQYDLLGGTRLSDRKPYKRQTSTE